MKDWNLSWVPHSPPFFNEKLDSTSKEVLNRYREIKFNMVTRYSWVLLYEIFPNVTWEVLIELTLYLYVVCYISVFYNKGCFFLTGAFPLLEEEAMPDVTIKNRN